VSGLSHALQLFRSGALKTRIDASTTSQIGFLQTAFNEMAERIETMVIDLRKLDQMKTDFVSTVSHELRTPLTSIGGYVKLLLSGDAGPLTPTQSEFLQIIDTNVVRLSNLINDILDVAKVESGKVQIRREPQDLVSILQECSSTFEVLAKQKGLELRSKILEAASMTVVGDRDRLVQVFMNLLSNAIKYTASGFVELDVTRHDNQVWVAVRDSGIGLTSEDKKRLFQKFYRAREIQTADGGTGLGLVIARGLVEAHGGSIGVESEPARGTCFTVKLPLADSIVVTRDRSGSSQIAKGPLRPIWVIDPNVSDAQMISGLVRETGLGRAREFAGLDEVPEISTHADAPAMVILDPTLPGGIHKVIPSLRDKLHETVPILVVGGSENATSAFAEGASAWLPKPINAQKLTAAMHELAVRRGWRILIADSNTDLRLLIKRALEQKGFEVDDLDRGNLVLSRLQQQYYDLVIMDLGLPDVSAIELLKIIHRIPRFNNLPVFVMSLEDRPVPTDDELRTWGAMQFIPKYRGLSNIIESVVQFLEDKKLLEQHN
jgi:signal transduction histidine kinase/DNA-binding response OmpR family regulator